jgi:uncharacterized protein DUF2171
MVVGRQRARLSPVTNLSSAGAQSMDIREHIEIVDSEGKHVGTVDKVEGERIKLTKTDSPTASTTSSTRSRSPPWRATR